MKITRKQLKLIIERLLTEEHGPQGLMDKFKSLVGRGAYYAVDPSLFYTVKGGMEDTAEWTNAPQQVLDFLDLLGLIHFTQNASEAESTTKNRETLVVTSLYRDGMMQANAILAKINKGETREAIVSLYSGVTGDPYMGDITSRTAGDVYDLLVQDPPDLEAAANLIDEYPISAHSETRAVDLRADTPLRKDSIEKALLALENFGYADIYYQFEPVPPHWHITPANPKATANFLTSDGIDALNSFRTTLNIGASKEQQPDSDVGIGDVLGTARDFYFK